MRCGTWLGAAGMAAGLLAAPGLRAENAVVEAAKALAAKPSYAWTATPQDAAAGGAESGRRGGRGGGPIEGRTEKNGFTVLSMKSGETTVEGVLKGDKVVVKSGDAWKTPEEFAGGAGGAPQDGNRPQRDPAQFMARRLRAFRLPAAEAEDLADKAAGLKAEGDAIVGELPESVVRELLAFGRGRGGDAPAVAGAKGSVSFWVRDGVLVKYQVALQGSVTFGDRQIDLKRTTVTEIKEIGTAKVDVPDAAKQKLP